MMSWAELYGQHRALRNDAGQRSLLELRTVLRRLSELPGSILDANAHQRLQPCFNPKSALQAVQLGDEHGEALHLYAHAGFDTGAIQLADARLVVQMLFHRGDKHLHQLTIMVEGTRRAGGPWVVAVHLHDDRVSEKNPGGDRAACGACGHPALHAHVGPTMNDEPKVRVPLPGFGAGQLLEWVLSQVVPTLDFEAAPWANVPA